MRERSNRNHVVRDIETTGVGWDGQITVSGFCYPGAHATLLINTGPHTIDTDSLEVVLEDACGCSVRVHDTDDETFDLEYPAGGIPSSVN